MAEVLRRFDDPITAPDGTAYEARVCGGSNENGMWEGWLEFVSLDGGVPVRSARETTQPNRTDTAYWATGLTQVYAEGSLKRALAGPVVRKSIVMPKPSFDSPAPSVVADDVPVGEAVLNPFSVYEKGEALLRRQLAAFSAWHLVNIVIAYRLSDLSVTSLNALPAASLIDLIVAAVRDRSLVR
jgi:hypothetical protein